MLSLQHVAEISFALEWKVTTISQMRKKKNSELRRAMSVVRPGTVRRREPKNSHSVLQPVCYRVGAAIVS